jgi:UrcA family protein
MNIRHTTLGLVAAATGLIVTSGAMAASTVTVTGAAHDVQTRSETISYEAADLKTAAGAEKLMSHLGSAATNVCREPGTIADNFEDPGYRTCRQNAMEQAVVNIDRPELTAAYEHRYPRRRTELKAALERQASAPERRSVG